MDVPAIKRDLVYDVGAHRGEDSTAYLALGYRVVAIEADPVLGDLLRKQFAKDIADGRYVLVNKCIGREEGEVRFFVNTKLPLWNTADEEQAKRFERIGAPSREVVVPAIPFAQVVAEHGVPYYLKVDIEGSDHLCLEALQDCETTPEHLSVEADFGTWERLVAQVQQLEALGYAQFCIVPQGGHGESMVLDARGKRVRLAFDSDGTGPFGSSLSGPWYDGKEVLRRYRDIYRGYRARLRLATFLRSSWPGRLVGALPMVGRLTENIAWYDTHARR